MPATVVYSEALIRRAIFRFWLRSIGRRAFVIFAVMLALCIAELFWQPEAWFFYGITSLLVLVALLYFAIYSTYLHRSLAKFRRMNDPIAEITISDSDFHIKSSLGETRLQWRAFEAIWRFPEAWLLFTGKNNFFTLPIDSINIADRELICAKIIENGGRVT